MKKHVVSKDAEPRYAVLLPVSMIKSLFGEGSSDPFTYFIEQLAKANMLQGLLDARADKLYANSIGTKMKILFNDEIVEIIITDLIFMKKEVTFDIITKGSELQNLQVSWDWLVQANKNATPSREKDGFDAEDFEYQNQW